MCTASTVNTSSWPTETITTTCTPVTYTMSRVTVSKSTFCQSMLTIQTGTLPPTINYENPDTSIELDVVPNVKRDHAVTSVLSNSFGFGGQNACLVMTAEPA